MSGVGYDNCQILSPQGELLSYTSNKKGEWYLRKSLAEKVSDKPLIIKLLFQPQIDYKLTNDPFYKQVLPSLCVVCGIKNNLTKHHCVPSCFRQHFPYEYKAHNYHDIVLLCLDCHLAYELEAEVFKKELRQQHSISLRSPKEALKRFVFSARLLLQALNGELPLPANKVDHFQSLLSNYLDKSSLTTEDLKGLSELEVEDPNYNPSQLLVSKVDIPEFIKLWRKHFVDTMQPKHLPAFWSMEKIYLVKKKKSEK